MQKEKLMRQDASQGASCVSNKASVDVSTALDVSLRMSRRLITVADMLGRVSKESPSGGTYLSESASARYKCVADVGCDHGYVSICLVQKGTVSRAIAMDVRKGPLGMAKRNIEDFCLSDKIEVRLSDGLSELSPGEADALVIAGMGGRLMIDILKKKDLRALGIRTMILQPQSDLEEFRRYIIDAGFFTEDEKIIFDEGKYYFPMRVSVTPSGAADRTDPVSLLSERFTEERARRLHLRYGTHNILRLDETFHRYLLHGREVCVSVLSNLDPKLHFGRYQFLQEELSDIECLIKEYNN